MSVDTVRRVVDNSGRKKHFFPEPGTRIDLGTLVEKQAKKHGDKTFLIRIETGEECSYREFNEMVNRTAHGLSELGIRKGDYVATMILNRCEHLFVCHALNKLGAPEAIINNEFVGEPLSRLINLTGTRYLITEEACLDTLRDVRDELKHLEHVVLIDGQDRGVKELPGCKVTGYRDILSDDISNPPSVVFDDAEVALLLPTSGTTGFSKACMVSHRFCVSHSEHTRLFLEITDKDTAYSFYPLFHGAARYYDVLPTFMAGGRVVLRNRFSLSNFWPDVVRYGCTFFMGLGSVQAMLYNAEACPEEKMHNLRLAWSCPDNIPGDEWRARFNVEMLPTAGHYSETFVGTVTTIRRGEPGGIVRSVYEVKILDENDEEVPDGQVGQMAIRPTEPGVMSYGFYNMPGATLKVCKNLWYHTGDMGKFDEQGYFYFLGRMMERIRVRGENVSATEVEEIFLNHPKINDCAVIGVPSDLGEEDVKLYAQLKAAVDSSADVVEELLEFGRDNLNKYMAPRYVELVDGFTRTQTGKIKKDVLLKIHQQAVAEIPA